ncbi:hypothetical protein COO60DRAFT_453095 [Scenedesmus sp. NREL 46B-D3]|nr:hypothetical protein COO60DRAFT_453095 [Scenedesmus sp. NREL 46B-D3]
MHVAWLPLEVLELPSSLFEAFCMDAACLQVLCRHSSTGQQLPADLAAKLAGFMRSSHYSPLLMHHTVLAMLVDLQLATVVSRPLGSHAAHMTWQSTVGAPAVSATPGVPITLQQMASLPRLLASAGQGYGYAVAWCLAQLLQPALLQHVHEALAAQQQPAAAGTQQSVPEPASSSSGSSSSRGGAGWQDSSSAQRVRVPAGRQLWQRFLGQGGGLADAAELVGWVALLQAHADVATDAARGGGGRLSVADALREQGMWPMRAGGGGVVQREAPHPLDVLGVCLGCALAQIACD